MFSCLIYLLVFEEDNIYLCTLIRFHDDKQITVRLNECFF